MSLLHFGNGHSLAVSGATIAGQSPTSTFDSNVLIASLRAMEKRLLDGARLAGPPVTWSDYHSNPAVYAGRIVKATAADFANGTLRLTRGCVLSLEEDVTFHPRPDNDFWPDGDEFAGRGFHLGFFAAIAVENDEGTVILGNRHTLKQSRSHLFKQRFIQLIELASQPFPPAQGPGNFGVDPKYARNVVIRDLTLDENSHEGLHGNLNRDILVDNVTFRNHEVAAAALNGPQRVAFINCHSLNNQKSVPAKGNLNAARFALRFVDTLINDLPAPHTVHTLAALATANQRLHHLWDDAFADLVADDAINPDTHPEAHALFANRTKVMDGQGYGFLIHPSGVAVNGFLGDRTTSKSMEATDIAFDCCSSSNAAFAPHEHTALVNVVTNKVQQGPTGDTIRIREIMDENGAYAGDALSDVHMLLADALAQLSDPSLRSRYGGVLTIDPAVVDWALRSSPPTFDSLWANGGDSGYVLKGNLDFQAHIGKGVVGGLRLDGVLRGSVTNFTLKNVSNSGKRALSDTLPGMSDDARVEYDGRVTNYGGAENHQGGYWMADARGVCLSACKDLVIDGLSVDGLSSDHGNAVAVEVQNGCDNICILDLRATNVTARDSEYEHSDCVALGVRVDSTCKRIKVESECTAPAQVFGKTQVISN